MSRIGFVSAVVLATAGSAVAATYYIRTDGGTASQCTGLADAPYPGGGVSQPCAWNHPFWALPPGGVQAPRLLGGDTLIIDTGSYRMGYGAPNTADCDAAGSFDCTMAPLPSGPATSQPTRILGQGHDLGCPNPPELWGAERPWFLLDLTGTSNAVVACLNLTDHSSCIEFHTGGLACNRDSPPYGDWASAGLYASDSSNVFLQHLNIHGFAEHGVLAGRLTDWTVENVRVAHNGWAGWDGDILGNDSNSGTLAFHHLTIEWNGCSESYPGGSTTGCWAQSAGGYGDGLGTGLTAGRWVFEDSAFLHNTSDGLDLLYMDSSASVEVRRTYAEGNAGNQIKVGSTATIENSVVVGNCGFFDGKPFTYDVDNCRALGNALSIDLGAGTQSSIVSSTVYSQGDCILLIGNNGCNGSETLLSRNNIFVGDTDFLQPFENSCFAYNDGCPGNPLAQDYGIIYNVKNNPCPVGTNDLCSDPLLVSSSGSTFDARLTASSPAIDSGLPVGGVIPNHDLLGFIRPAGAGVDRGAYEFGAGPPLVTGGAPSSGSRIRAFGRL